MITRKDVEAYYKNRVQNGEGDDFLWQVGKTVNGEPVGDDQIQEIVRAIKNNLDLEKDDNVLDIGCGNGILTSRLSKLVSSITGIELTGELCDLAIKYNHGENITYINSDILGKDFNLEGLKYNKVYLYEVAQHFDTTQMRSLFKRIHDITAADAKIFIGGVLDQDCKWKFFDTEQRKDAYFDSLLLGKELVGTWYSKEYLDFLARRGGYRSVFLRQSTNLYTSHYRFDYLLKKI